MILAAIQEICSIICLLNMAISMMNKTNDHKLFVLCGIRLINFKRDDIFVDAILV